MGTPSYPPRGRVASVAACAAFLLTVGCAEHPSAADDHAGLHPPDAVAASSSVGATGTGAQGLLKAVHAATARFHSTVQATRAGYAQASGCVASSAGGMGYHWVKPANVDPSFDPLEPEAVLYAPDARGNLKLVAVEYIVIDVGQPAPTFDGHPFDVGGTPVPAPHWSLHVWVHRPNPNGTFVPFNPAVSCTP